MLEEHPTRLDRLMQVVAEHHPMHAELRLHFDGFHVLVESSSELLVRKLADYFRHYVHNDVLAADCDLRVVAIEASEPDLGLAFRDWPCEPAKQGAKEQLADLDGGRVVRTLRTGMHFLLGPDLSLAVGACARHHDQVIDLISAGYTQRLVDAGWVSCHAAAVAWQGTGLGLAGLSGAGQSTLALRLLDHGAHFVSDEGLLVRQVGRQTRMSGLPKRPRVRSGTLLGNPTLRALLTPERAQELSQLPEQALWALDDPHDVDIERIYGPGRIALTASLRAFVILTWDRASTQPTRVTHTTLGESPHLLPILAKHPGPFHRGDVARASESAAHALDAAPYLAALRALPIVELSGRVDFELAERVCVELNTLEPVQERAATARS